MPNYHCVAKGCTSDVRKKGKYGYMMSVRFFAFPPKKNVLLRKKWLDRLQRVGFEPTRNDRICSLHFVDGEPTDEHPYPEIFSHNVNNHQQRGGKRSANSTLEISQCAESMDLNCSSTEKAQCAENIHLNNSSPEMTTDVFPNSTLVNQHECSSTYPLPLKLEVTEEPTEYPGYYEVPSDHEYIKTDSVSYETDSRSVETQTELTMSDLDNMQEKLMYLEKRLNERLEDNDRGSKGESS